jgi:hypothetical protein
MICLCLTESRASKILMLDDHSYIDMAINCIPHVHPFWDNLQSPKPCVYWGSSCAGGVKDHDGWIYQSTGHFEWFCLPIWTIYHLDSFPVLLIHFNLKKKTTEFVDRNFRMMLRCRSQRVLWILCSIQVVSQDHGRKTSDEGLRMLSKTIPRNRTAKEPLLHANQLWATIS